MLTPKLAFIAMTVMLCHLYPSIFIGFNIFNNPIYLLFQFIATCCATIKGATKTYQHSTTATARAYPTHYLGQEYVIFFGHTSFY